MNALYEGLCILAVISLSVSGCAAQPAQSGQDDHAAPKTAIYESILGKPLSDVAMTEFLASNECSSANHFLLCHSAGIALWIESNQVVETVYLYLNNDEGFSPYQGELPHGLKFYDIMGSVEHKLRKHGLGNGGLPDEGDTPDFLHYWATYQQAGMTIIYNSPSPEDEDATIYAIFLSN
jgi:hypothetical protein